MPKIRILPKYALVLLFSSSLPFSLYLIFTDKTVHATTFADDTKAEFDGGTYSDTQWDEANSWVELTASGKTNGSGNYTSSVKDAGEDLSWDNIAWVPDRPTGKELLNNATSETVYNLGNADMTGNVLLMHLNEAGGTILDSSGQGNNGTYNGVLYSQTGKLNIALGFDGIDDYVLVGNSPSLDIYGTNNPVSLEAWIKFSDAGVNDLVIHKGTYPYEYGFGTAADSKLDFRVNDNGAYKTVASPSAVDTAWHHWVGVYNTTKLLLYKDGSLVNSVNHSGVVSQSTYGLSIGRYGPGSYAFNGTMDEVAIFNRALSNTEIADHYKRGALRLKFQVRSGNTSPPTGDFIGPDGTTTDYYEWGTTNSTSTPSFNLTNVSDNRYFQYKAYFETDNSSYTPKLKRVIIDYNVLNNSPNTPTNSSPYNGATNQSLTPSLTSSAFSDPDVADTHAASQWQISTTSGDYSSPTYDSGTNVSDLTSITIPSSTLSLGTTFYWHVRYRDNHGDWSNYSTETSFTTSLPLYSTTKTWDFLDSSDYTFDNVKIEISSSQAQLKATSNWYNTSWGFRKPITIDNTGNASDLTNYQVEVSVAYNSNMQTDFDDIRFTDSDGTTLIDNWRETYIDSTSATFWVDIPSISGASSKTIYMYYGNSVASTASNDADTFITGADFNDGTTTGLTINTAGSATATVPSITSEQLFGLRIDGFSKFPDNPVLPKRVGKWDSFGTREITPVISDTDGKIVKSSGKITAYYWGTNLTTMQIGITKSSDDGYTWGERLDNPVIAPSGVAGSWYKTHVFQPSVIKRSSDGLYMMMATGWETTSFTTSSLGVFTSSDGINWTDQGQKLTLNQFNYDTSNGIYEMGVPRVIKRSAGDYLVLFEGRKTGVANAWRIFAATSSDFTGTWVPFNDGDPIFQETGSSWESVGTANSQIIEINNGQYILAYNGTGSVLKWRVGFASSTDLLTWTRYLANPVIEPGTGWDTLHTETSFFVKEKSDYLRFYYQGFGSDGSHQIGLATAHQGRVLNAKSTATADGWVVGKDLDSINNFSFEVLTQENNDSSIAGASVHGMIDFASVPNPMADTSWNPQARFIVGRNSPTDANANKFYIQYTDTGGSNHFWDGNAWQTSPITYFGGAGLYKVRIWDDGTNYYADITKHGTDASTLSSVATIAKTSVRAFSDGRVIVSSEPLTNSYYLGMNLDNWIVRNYSSPEPSATVGSEASETIVFSSTDPVIQPTTANSQTFISLSGFSEAATKNGGEIKYQISNDAGSTWYWWNGPNWTTTTSGYSQANTASEINTNISNFPIGSGQFLFKTYLHSDGSQLVQLDSITLTYTKDDIAPTGTISINNDSSYTTSRSVTLTISASDNIDPASSIQMQVSNNSDFSDASWESYASSKSWTLTSGDGTKTAYVRFKDSIGNMSSTFSDSIGLIEARGTLRTRVVDIETTPEEGETLIEDLTETGEEVEEIKSYDVRIKVIDKKNKPIKDAHVYLFSDPKEEVTDEEGIAFFEGVEAGEHKVVVKYASKVGEETINLEEEGVKTFEITIKIEEVRSLLDYLIPCSLSLIALFLAILVVIQVKKRVKK